MSLGFCSCLASLFLCLSNVLDIVLTLGLKRLLSSLFGSAFSIAISVSDRRRVRLLLPFSGQLILICFVLKSMSVHCSDVASPILAPVSYSNCNRVLVLFPVPAISCLTSSSCGKNGSFSGTTILGFCHSENKPSWRLTVMKWKLRNSCSLQDDTHISN